MVDQLLEIATRKSSFKDHTSINIRWVWPGQSIPCELFLLNLKMPWRRWRSRCSSGPGEESSTSTEQGGKRNNRKSLQIWIILGDGMICHKEVLWNVTKISIINFFSGAFWSSAVTHSQLKQDHRQPYTSFRESNTELIVLEEGVISQEKIKAKDSNQSYK